MKASEVEYIVVHCSAGFGNVESIQRFWKRTLGWRSPGYHVIIEQDGTEHQLSPFDKPTNGVKSFNDRCLHVCYIGGVELVDDEYKAKDTRTVAQKQGLHKVIQRMIAWLQQNGKDVTKNLSVVGHRDFSPDQNGDGAIAPWERIKECPSFDAIAQYSGLYSSADRYRKLPKK